MYFGAEIWSGSKNLTDDTFYFWVYLIFFNFLWVIFPLLLLWQSWNATKDVYKRAERNKRKWKHDNAKEVLRENVVITQYQN